MAHWWSYEQGSTGARVSSVHVFKISIFNNNLKHAKIENWGFRAFRVLIKEQLKSFFPSQNVAKKSFGEQ